MVFPSSRCTSPIVRFCTSSPNPSRWRWRRSQSGDGPQDVGEQASWNGYLGHLERPSRVSSVGCRLGEEQTEGRRWLAFTGAIVGEFVAATRGLGYLLSFAQSTCNAALMFAPKLLIMTIVLVIFALGGRIERRLSRWN